MHLLALISPALLALLTLSTPSKAAKKTPKDAILLSSVKTLTLRNNAMTSHRRVSAIPQLTCKGPGCAHFKIDVMRCTNAGSSYGTEEVEWACTASLPDEFKLGSTDVACEGYANRDDEYVLKGSCGVEYRLLLTDAGEEKYGSNGFWGSKKGKSSGDGEGWTLSSVLFVFAFLGVLGWIIYSAYDAAAPAVGRQIPRRPGGFWGGGWGGGGGGGGAPYDPPPPYPGTGRKNYSQQQQGWQPGFWSGALGGAAAGYMAGNRGNNRQEPVPQRQSSWFGGGGSSGGAPARSSSSSSSSYSSTRHESTGFGSTSRR